MQNLIFWTLDGQPTVAEPQESTAQVPAGE